MLAPPKIAPGVRVFYPAADVVFEDTHMLDSLDLRSVLLEADLQHASVEKHVRFRASGVFREGAQNRSRERMRAPFCFGVRDPWSVAAPSDFSGRRVTTMARQGGGA